MTNPNLSESTKLVNFSTFPDDHLEKFVSTGIFLRNEFIHKLVEMTVQLGFSIETIKETLKLFLSESKTSIDLMRPDYESIINYDKFLERLIGVSNEVDNNSHLANKASSVVASGQTSEFDNDDDYTEDDDQFSGTYTNTEITSQFDQIKNSSTYNSFKPQMASYQSVSLKAVTPSSATALTAAAPTTLKTVSQQQQESANNLKNDKTNLRPIIIDANDVALSSHPNSQTFMISRVKKVVDYFEKRNHQIFVILSHWRREQIMAGSASQQEGALTVDQQALLEMESKGQTNYIPSKKVGAKRIVCDDDTPMLRTAFNKSGIIVSNDNFKRFLNTDPDFKQVIEERVLMYSFIDDTFMPAEDPLGKNGPNLENFLRFESVANQHYMKRCPYRKKCTYGTKCKFQHPERATQPGSQYKTAHQSVLEEAQQQKIRLEIIMNSQDSAKENFFLNNALSTAVATAPSSSDAKQQQQQHKSLVNSVQIFKLSSADSTMDNDLTSSLQQYSFGAKSQHTNDFLYPLNNAMPNKQQQQFATKMHQPHSHLRAMGAGECANAGINNTNMYPKPTATPPHQQLWSGLDFDSLNLNEQYTKSYLINTEFTNAIKKAESKVSPRGKLSPASSHSPSPTQQQHQQQQQQSKEDEKNSPRDQLMDLVRSGHLKQEQVDKVLSENPTEKNIDKLVFLASDTQSEFDF
jgi:hypothetical protein